MNQATAQLSNFRQSPRKIRIVADTLRGKKVSFILGALDILAKRSSAPLKKLLLSAVSNAKQKSMKEEDLVVKEIRVDGGAILYRRRPRSRGMANPIRKRTSHVSVILEEKVQKIKKSKTLITKSQKLTPKS